MIERFDESEFFRMLKGRLDERTSRLVAAAAAKASGRGSIGQHIGNADYGNRKVTINTTGNVSGNFQLCGGTGEYIQGELDAKAVYAYGIGHAAATKTSGFGDADLVGFPLVARVGQPLDTAPDASVANGFQVLGQLYRNADAAFAAPVANDGVWFIQDCSFTNVVRPSVNYTLGVATNVTLTWDGTDNYPILVDDGVTLTLDGEGALYKNTGSSTFISAGNEDDTAVADGGNIILNGNLTITDGTGSNAICVDSGTFVMNGGIVKNTHSDSGNAVRASNAKDAAAAVVTVNAGTLDGAGHSLFTKNGCKGTVVIAANTDTLKFNNMPVGGSNASPINPPSGYESYEVTEGADAGWWKLREAAKPAPYVPIPCDNPAAKVDEINTSTEAKKAVMSAPGGATVSDTYYELFSAVPAGNKAVAMVLNDACL